jgi:hypothetical protein
MSAEGNTTHRCIYCLETKPAATFDSEHIIPQSFGRFEVGPGGGPTTLHCVCRACNHAFGKTLDRALARDSVLGLLRYSEGVRDPREFKPPSRGSGLTITPVQAEPDEGAKYRLGAGRDGTFGFELETTIGFAKQPEEPYEFFSLDMLPSRQELLVRFGPRPAFLARGFSREQVEALMHAFGFRLAFTHETPAPQRADVTIPIGRLQFRAIGKIAFNYFAWVMGAPVACMPDFNGLRAYIIHGERPGPSHVSVGVSALDVLDAQGNTRRGHFVTAESGESGFISQVSLFSAIRFRVDLTHVPLAVSVPCGDGHFFDLDARRVERFKPPPVRGQVVPAPPGARIRLDR